MIFNILRSIVIVIFISLSLAGVMFGLGFSFMKTFAIVFCGQLLFTFIGYQIVEPISMLRNKQLENERIKEFSKQGVEIECASCNMPVIIPIRFDRSNNFTCDNCGAENSVYINITAAQKTTPMDINPLSINTYVDKNNDG